MIGRNGNELNIGADFEQMNFILGGNGVEFLTVFREGLNSEMWFDVITQNW